MNRQGLRQRLLIGFVTLSLILLIVGMIGWKEVRSTSASIDGIALLHLPAVHHLQNIQDAGNSITAAQRTLLIPRHSP